MKPNRRDFLRTSTVIALGAVLPGTPCPAGAVATRTPAQPWYRRTLRWGQTNITEGDVANYDIDWWRGHWKRTRVQGVIINAGGIVAYYPSEDPLQYRAAGLGQRDLFGEVARAAHDAGLVVLARMDSNRTHADFYRAHPDWFAADAAGAPYKAGELFVTCVNSPFYENYIPERLQEIARRHKPEGFADNSWSGLGRDSICFCANCRKRFLAHSGHELPARKDWDDPVYRDWILWNYARRMEIWDLNNRAAQAAGGPECVWTGMISGSISGQCASARDTKAICARAELLLLDHQARGEGGFAQNAEIGNLLHDLLGWNKLIPESMAMYQAGRPTFRKTAKPEPEARLWMLEGIAGGLQPWWHHVGAFQEDRRQFQSAEAIYRWHEANEQYLVNCEPLATVGLAWSQRNTEFYGRDHPTELVEAPWRGWAQALVRARIPYVPIEADQIESQGKRLTVLILPNLGSLSDPQANALRRFVRNGGALIATGHTGLYDPWGQARADFALADLLGAHFSGETANPAGDVKRAGEALHTYLRLAPDASKRHPVLRGFESTAILPFGGGLGDVTAEAGAEILLTFVPPFPAYPPETSWMRQPRTDIPGLVLQQPGDGGKVAFLIADLDRRYAVDGLPDHAKLMSNLVHWAAGERLPLRLEGAGLVDCHLYQQGHRVLVHMVNLTTAGPSRGPVDEIIPVGPLTLEIQLPEEVKGETARLLVAGKRSPLSLAQGRASLKLPLLSDHELVVIGEG